MADILLADIGGGKQDEIPALLRQIDCNVVLAEDTDEALGLATGGDWDLIVLDVGILDQSCLEICQRVKELTTTIPLVILSAASSDESLVRGFCAGADDFIIKPVTAVVFVARISALLRRARWLHKEKELTMEQGMNRGDWAEMEGLSHEEKIMLTCNYALQVNGKREAPPYEMFQISGGAYLVKTPKSTGPKHINLILSD